MSRRTTVYLNKNLEALLKKYAERLNTDEGEYGQSATLTEILGRYDELVRAERRRLRDLFEENEINLLLNNALSTIYSYQTIIGAVLADTEDEDPSQFEFFGVDRAALIEKLRNLTPGQQFALVDWLEEMRSAS
ncbi:conserved hypothetical protein [uncultured spirochete]|uniref:Uncharacterized protein n=1 Tax=uncultured spirochete TaxID=156406 RepID=A0A3P3XL89_9SPIR|nr:conserved hypothetical protein [uncultured spirochete]